MNTKCPACGEIVWYKPGESGSLFSPPEPEDFEQDCECELSEDQLDKIREAYYGDLEWP